MSGDGNEDKDRKDEGLPDFGHHLSDEEIERALAGFEAEFGEGQDRTDRNTDDDSKDDSRFESDVDSESGTEAGAGDETGPTGEQPMEQNGNLDGVADFDQELEGLIGNRAKAAVMVTRLASAELLAAFCQISDISAWCIQAREGAVAVLRNLDGDGPEAAIRDLTTVVSGLSAILAVNRADKLESTLWINGQSGQTFAPPMLFASTADFVEDLMIGTTTVDRLREEGATIFDSGEYNREKAMGIIAAHTRFGAGGSARKGRVE